jgi:hypothetical protein
MTKELTIITKDHIKYETTAAKAIIQASMTFKPASDKGKVPWGLSKGLNIIEYKEREDNDLE